jgi:hypothetical protein
MGGKVEMYVILWELVMRTEDIHSFFVAYGRERAQTGGIRK